MKQRITNYITLEFPSRSSNEGFARTAVACFAAQLDPTLNELEDIKTAVSEAVTNAIVHAYPVSLGKITLKVSACEGNLLEITVKDRDAASRILKKRVSLCIPPAARNAAAWDLLSWRVSWIVCLFGLCRGKAPRW